MITMVWVDVASIVLDATRVELLYAERRGTPTRRVALGRNVQGSRWYKPIVLKVEDAENGHGEDTRNADDAPPEQRGDMTYDV